MQSVTETNDYNTRPLKHRPWLTPPQYFQASKKSELALANDTIQNQLIDYFFRSNSEAVFEVISSPVFSAIISLALRDQPLHKKYW